jgi:hypothetical protein
MGESNRKLQTSLGWLCKIDLESLRFAILEFSKTGFLENSDAADRDAADRDSPL